MSDKYEEQEQEVEALQSIFVEDFTLVEEKPYKFEIQVNANSESQDKNYIKLRMIIELADDYPESLPNIRIKNLVPDIIHNNKMAELEDIVAEKAKES